MSFFLSPEMRGPWELPESAALLVVVARLARHRMPAAGFGLGPIDVLARHPAFQNTHELTTSVPEFLDPGAD